jgi:hypothetical protein
MDERLQKALEFSKYIVSLNSQKKLLKEKFLNDTVFYFNGGTFTITPQLISYVNFLAESKKIDQVIIDDNCIPIEISDTEKFLDSISEKYFSALDSYNRSYQDLRKQRSVENLVK